MIGRVRLSPFPHAGTHVLVCTRIFANRIDRRQCDRCSSNLLLAKVPKRSILGIKLRRGIIAQERGVHCDSVLKGDTQLIITLPWKTVFLSITSSLFLRKKSNWSLGRTAGTSHILCWQHTPLFYPPQY